MIEHHEHEGDKHREHEEDSSKPADAEIDARADLFIIVEVIIPAALTRLAGVGWDLIF
jgi:hypothetical protein